jgi:hypothetical protein
MRDYRDSAPSARVRRDPNGQLVKIFDAEYESEALIVKGLLDSMGIDCDITSIEAAQDVFPGVGGTTILVRGEDASQALRIIEESQSSLPKDRELVQGCAPC